MSFTRADFSCPRGICDTRRCQAIMLEKERAGRASGHAEGTSTGIKTGIKETEDKTRPGISQSHIMMMLPNALGIEYMCILMCHYIHLKRDDSAGE